MARDEQPEPVARAERPRRTGGAGCAGQRGELAVRHHLAPRHGAQRLGAAREEGAVVLEIDRHVRQPDVLSSEIRLQERHDRIVRVNRFGV